METTLLKKQLVTLGADVLAERLIELSMNNNDIAQEVELMILRTDSKKLAKKIKQTINGIKRSTRFIPWNEASEFSNNLYQISRSVEDDLLPRDPAMAAECIEKFFTIDKYIHERVDDSNGIVGQFYYSLSELWGKVWSSYPNRDSKSLAEKIYQLLLDNGYASKDHLIQHSASALGESGLAALENLINENKNGFDKHDLSWMHQAIADASGDPDKYIQVIKQYSVINEQTVCDIAERLLKKWRGTEAINWLLYHPDNVGPAEKSNLFDPSKVSCSKRFDLLIEAYESESMSKEAQSLRWILFEKTLNKDYYDALLKHQTPEEIKHIKNKAYQFACEEFDGLIDTLLEFLSNIQAYDELNRIIQKKYDLLSETSYHFYRPLSKALATAGYPLSATLLRRKLIDGVLNKAISKYYKYAVADLSISQRLAKEITQWHQFQTHSTYMENLETKHKRKSAFWSKVKAN